MITIDPLYDRAKEIVLGSNKITTTLLQKELPVGYCRARWLLDFMVEDGLIIKGKNGYARKGKEE